MSTKTRDPLNRDPEELRQLAVFAAVSLVVHLLAAWALLSITPPERRGSAEPMVVEVMGPGEAPTRAPAPERPAGPEREAGPRDVVELPPEVPPEAAEKKPPSAFAQRTQSVERETSPEPTPLPKGPSSAPASKGSPGADGREAVKGGSPKPGPFKEGSVKGEKDGVTGKAEPVESAEKPVDAAPGERAGEEALEEEALRAEPRTAEEPDVVVRAERAPAESKPAGEAEKTGEAAEAKPAPPAGGEIDRPGGEPGETVAEETGTGARRGLPGVEELFPSERRLGELAREYAESSPVGERGKTLQLNTSELKYHAYIMDMKRKINLRWEYPLLAARKGWQGVLQVDFTIKSDGTLGPVKVVKSSGYPVLDDAVLTALRLAAPFPPFPEHFEVEKISIKGHFEYIMRVLQRQGG